MALAAGSSLGSYQIVSALGAGGMGEVYRARDMRLGREVAIKILPELFVSDPERVARFEREAQLLASLNHPHIAAIHGFEEVPSKPPGAATKFLVLELVDGESLAHKLQAGESGLEMREALAIALQIVDALDAAHERGIVHRDLKPANIMLTADGQVKVLDFGLAKLEGSAGSTGSGAQTQSPTLTFAPTQAGVILGTAAYMSPEQAKGRAADRRSDVWSFGCVLFEMLTGARAFAGEDVSDTLAAVLRDEPDWDALPADLPDYLRTLLKRCLEKNRKARIADISVVRYVMTEVAGGPRSGVPAARGQQVVAIALGAAGILIGAAGIAVWLASRQAPQPSQTSRFIVTPAANHPLGGVASDRNVLISQDGTHIVYVGADNNDPLVVRALDRLEPASLSGVTNVRSPFLSPDGRWIGYFSAGQLKKISLSGGPSIPLCRFEGLPRGASWGADDTIVFATSDPATGLIAVPAAGGEPRVLTKPDTAHGETDHVLPAWLPGGAVLYTIVPQGAIDASLIAVLDLKSNQRKVLIHGGSQAEYVHSGHIVYGSAGTLRAVRFDLDRFEVISDPAPVVDHVSMGPSGAASFAVSRTGTLVYIPGGVLQQSLVWIDRQGHEEPTGAPPRAYYSARLSPDGGRAALEIRDQEQDIWIWDFSRKTMTRLTFDPSLDSDPIWTADGRRIVYASQRGGQTNIFWQSSDGTGSAEQLTKSANPQLPASVTPDGTRLIFREGTGVRATDLRVLTLDGHREVRPLLEAALPLANGEISPDGRWLAYQSDESGQPEVFVRPFPNVNEGRWQVSTTGGTRPLWTRDGRELFYLDRNNLMTLIKVVSSSTSFRTTSPVKVLDTPAAFTIGIPYRSWDISPDGKRFLVIKERRDSDTKSAPTPGLVVVQNWAEELKARLPSK